MRGAGSCPKPGCYSTLDAKLDTVLTHTRQVADGTDYQVIQAGRPYVLISPEHRLAGRTGVWLAELADDDVVLLDIPSVRGMVARGLGYTVLVQRPPLDISYEGLPLIALPIEGPIGHSDICLAYPARQKLSRKLQALVDYCCAYSPPDVPG